MVCGAMAICALPPFNGLIGEWYIYRALLESSTALTGLPAFFPAALTGLLALVGGMVILVMTRIIGIALAGEPRSEKAAEAHEAGWPMRSAMIALSLLCLAGGMMPFLLLRIAGQAASILDPETGSLFAGQGVTPWWLGAMALLLFAAIIAAFTFSRWRQGQGMVACAGTWGCGFSFPSSRMAYTAEGYTEYAQNSILGNRLTAESRGGLSICLFPVERDFVFTALDPVLERIFRPLFRKAADYCRRCCRLQSGNLHIYLLYIFSTTILLLFWVEQR
jgi:NADH:ubiquinone oxidoreductase subunit 5 (subunit L)/multisubunit Na+/H+ antiporter MnhA subunit